MSSCTIPGPIRLHRPRWRRLLDALWRDSTAWRFGAGVSVRNADARAYASLAELSPAVLKDIGAPAWIAEHRRAREETEQLHMHH